MSASNRATAVAVPIAIWSILILYGFIWPNAMHNNWLYLLSVVGVIGLSAQLWWMFYADRWRGFAPPAGVAFAPAAAELPILADHRKLFGEGAARNVMHGPNFVAFEVVKSGRRHWYYVVQLQRPHGRWHAAPPTTNNGWPKATPEFQDRYDATGPVPAEVKRLMMAAPLAELDVRVEGDLLIATDIAMSGGHFAEWYPREGTLVQRIARVLEPEGPAVESAARPAITKGDPARNVWDGQVATPVEQPVADPVWKQPPRRCPATAAVAPRPDRPR